MSPTTRSRTRPRLPLSNKSGRIYIPPTDAVIPSEERILKSHRDNNMIKAFGLENDMKHWSRMKATGMKFCEEELPPKTLSRGFCKKHGFSNEERQRLEYNGYAKTTKKYVWEFGLASWKKAFDYDIQYLQRRFPQDSAKDIICGLISQWNSGAKIKVQSRKYAKGRDLHQLYSNSSTARDSKGRQNTDNSRGTRHALLPSSAGRDYSMISHTDTHEVRDTTSNLSSDQDDRVRSDEQDQKETDVYWPFVMLDIQHADQTKGVLDRLAFSFICGSQACRPGNIRMEAIKNELQDQGVVVEDFFLRLKGSQENLRWELRSICLALTIWRRNRSDIELDIPFLLMPRLHQDISTQPYRDASFLSYQTDRSGIATDKTSQDDEISTTQSNRTDHTPSPKPQCIDIEMAETSAEDQISNDIKRKRKGSPPAVRSDSKNLQTIYLDLIEAYEAGDELTDDQLGISSSQPL